MTTLLLIATGLTLALALTRAGAAAWLTRLLREELGALTLAEAAKLSNDVVLQGVYESILKASDISLVLPYTELNGNAIAYNRENVAPTVAWFAVGDTWTEGVATFSLISKQLCIVGGDADVDNYIQMSRSNVQDIRATILLGKAQALQREWDDKIINGTGASNQPDGLDTIIAALAAGQSISNGANGASLTLAMLDVLIDTVQGAAPDFLLMSRRSRRSINALFRASGASMETRPDFGRFIQFYNGTPILISDYISDAKTVGTSTDCSTIYAGRLGEENGGLYAVYNSSGQQTPIIIDEVGNLETKDAFRTRVKAYVQLCQGSGVTIARTLGIRP